MLDTTVYQNDKKKGIFFSKAIEALDILFVAPKKLSLSEMETLEILMDEKLKKQIKNGLKDIKMKKISPIESIL